MNAQASLRIGTDSPGPSLYAYTKCESVCNSDQKNKLSLSHSCACMIVTRLSVKAQASLRIGTEQFMHTPSVEVYEGQTKTRILAPSQSCACLFV